MIKKVVIAAAGRGTRMKHLTVNKCKHLIKVVNRPFLAYVLDNLIKAGYKDLILVVGYKGELVEEYIKESGYKVKVINQYKELGEKEYGTLCPLKVAAKEIGNEDFLFVNGDNLYSVNDLKAMNIDDEYNYAAGLEKDHPEKYGVLLLKGGLLEKIVEKPKEYVGDIVNVGLYKFKAEALKRLSEVKRSERGEYEITDLINLLAKEKKVKMKEIKEFWKDFGNPGDIIKLSKFIKNGSSCS